jgi:uncharacterized membrane protein (UPF0182 family)
MGDLFDEFKREIERRRAEAEGRRVHDDHGQPKDNESAGDHDDKDDRDREADEATASDDADTPADDDTDDDPRHGEPVPIHRRSTGGQGGGRGPRRPVGGPDDGAQPPTIRQLIRRAGLVIVVAAIVLFLFLFGTVVNLWTDVAWFKSVGFDSVFWTRLGAQVSLFAIALAATLVFLLVNLWLAGRFIPPHDPTRPGRIRETMDRWTETQRQAQRQAEHGARLRGEPLNSSPFGAGGPFGPAIRVGGGFDGGEVPDITPLAKWAIAGVCILVALGVAGAIAGAWDTIQLWAHRVPYSATGTVTDPVFGKDISFFLFELPFWRLLQTVINGVLLAALIVVAARYLVAAMRGGEVFITRVRVHLAVIGGLYLISIAFGYQLDKYELVYSQAGVATGVAFTDAHARFMAYDVLTFLSGIAGALLIAGAFTRWMWPLGLVVGVWFVASLLLGRVYPEVIQRFTVDPNTYAQEQTYIANNIAMTRLAFGLDQWGTQPYDGTGILTASDLTTEADTFTNARLWDYRPLQTTLDQLQTVRQYYNFVDVDTDRYPINNTLRQVMLSGRELNVDKNTTATGWVNQRIVYTHGVGLAMVPVNQVTPEGQPELWIKNLPPVSSNGAPDVTEPRIYFGESDNHYVVVGARQDEFDIPAANGASDTLTRWTGKTGVPLDNLFSRIMFASRFKDLDLLISDQITADSQLLFHRTLTDRIGMIAPFLQLDKDPYLVIQDGRLVYVQDAYTISDRFPNATSFNGADLGDASTLGNTAFNYIRNSVKITMDAYDGTLHFYVNDPSDPIIRAWQGVFPTLFEPLASMPSALQAHLRSPEQQFDVQTRMYGSYHVTNTSTFFNKSDRWTVPTGKSGEQSLPSEAYYVIMRMPSQPKAEFLLLQPMIAASRPNMTAWVAARNDGADRGAVSVYQFPSDTTVFGPAQIEARIDQDPIISSQITLWNQSGSSVVRGNLIVVPIGNSLVYLQPVYLQSTSSSFPEFQKIVVASPTSIVWANTLSDALSKLLVAQGGGTTPTLSPGPTASAGPGASATPAPSSSPGSLPSDVNGLIAYANTHFDLAQQALRAGDFATYGAEMDKVQAALKRLSEMTGGAVPTSIPTVAPSDFPSAAPSAAPSPTTAP